jgi:hypothetical protein
MYPGHGGTSHGWTNYPSLLITMMRSRRTVVRRVLQDRSVHLNPCMLSRFRSYTMFPLSNLEGESMGNLGSALQQLRAERKQAQLQVEKLDQAISVIESLNGSRIAQQTNQPTRIISQASRRKMARAQKARWARARNGSQSIAPAKTTPPARAKQTMSPAARRKIAAFQRARWAKIKAQQKKAA